MTTKQHNKNMILDALSIIYSYDEMVHDNNYLHIITSKGKYSIHSINNNVFEIIHPNGDYTVKLDTQDIFISELLTLIGNKKIKEII